jgi:uncharacterized membrane protein
MHEQDAGTPKNRSPLDRAVKDVAEIRAQQLRELPRSQLGIEWLTDRIGRPWFAYAIVVLIAAWIAWDTGARARVDAPPFPVLQLVLAVLSLLMTIFILTTENRQGAIAEKRAQLTLQLSLANEERAAKIIQLLEQLRKDDPLLPDRRDDEAREMAQAIDLHTAIDKMEDADARIAQTSSKDSDSRKR